MFSRAGNVEALVVLLLGLGLITGLIGAIVIGVTGQPVPSILSTVLGACAGALASRLKTTQNVINKGATNGSAPKPDKAHPDKP